MPRRRSSAVSDMGPIGPIRLPVGSAARVHLPVACSQRGCRMHKTSNRPRSSHPGTLHGGDVLGYGAYGCVFHPALAAIPGTPEAVVAAPGSFVTKVLKKRGAAAENEFRAGRKLGQHDPNNEWGVYPVGKVMDVTEDDLAAGGGECPLMDVATLVEGKYAAIHMPLVTPLESVLDQTGLVGKGDVRHKLRGLAHLCEGVKWLHAVGGYAHMDIKIENVAIPPSGADTKYALMDWGMAVKLDNRLAARQAIHLITRYNFVYPAFLFAMFAVTSEADVGKSDAPLFFPALPYDQFVDAMEDRLREEEADLDESCAEWPFVKGDLRAYLTRMVPPTAYAPGGDCMPWIQTCLTFADVYATARTVADVIDTLAERASPQLADFCRAQASDLRSRMMRTGTPMGQDHFMAALQAGIGGMIDTVGQGTLKAVTVRQSRDGRDNGDSPVVGSKRWLEAGAEHARGAQHENKVVRREEPSDKGGWCIIM